MTPTNHNRDTQSDEPIKDCNLLKAREKSRVQGTIGFGFGFHWLKNEREIFEPITKRRNRHLKTAL